MKKINFIKTIALYEHHIIHSWLIGTGIMVIVSVMLMAWFSLQQRRILTVLTREHSELSHYTQKYTTAQQEKENSIKTKVEYEKRLNTIDSYLCDAKNPELLLQGLIDICKKYNVSVQALMVDRANVSLRGAYENVELLADMVRDLESLSKVHNVVISSIEKHKREGAATEIAYLCTITAQQSKS